ncbi:MAG: phenylalanine--tRNA ligase subunit beta [Proteobacteria bacterium]|nr:phenylalanine--tRNA ligase subunit beta [Pseudomonadota bacterium]
MKFTFSWLKEHLRTTKTVEEIEQALIDIGLEVEEVIDPSKKLEGFVIADVVECSRHPDADRLSLCQINDGSGTLLQVICGAPNIRKGLKIAFARIGCLIPSSGEALKKGKIRGIESQGMICSAKELDLGEESNGILELNTTLNAGTPLKEAFNDLDAVFDISITPNRSDCFSVKGIARDLSAYGVGQFIDTPSVISNGNLELIPIQIDDKDCCLYFSVFEIKDVENKESPVWLKKRLEAIGQKSISALVDITNYIMFDQGQPLHVFDKEKIALPFCVRKATEKPSVKLLDEMTYSLNQEDLVVADQKEVHALAGIKGGYDSRALLETTHIYLEAATYNPVSIALSGQRHHLFSDGRARHERGIDRENIATALLKALSLILEICGGTVIGFGESGKIPKNEHTITLTKEFLEKKTGEIFKAEVVTSILQKAGFKTTFANNTWTIVTPSWRHDMTIKENLVEEILRFNGYHQIPESRLPLFPVHLKNNPLQKAKESLLYKGLDEVYTFSMVSKKTAELFALENDIIELKDPLNSELSTLRPSILPSLLNVALNNKAKSLYNTSIFEVAPVFFKKGEHYVQTQHITGLRFDKNHDDHWLEKSRSVDSFDAKSDVLSVLMGYGLQESSVQFDTNTPSYWHPKKSMRIKQGNKTIGYFGQIHPIVLKHFNCSNMVVGFEVDLEPLPKSLKVKIPSFSPSIFQPVMRDLAFICDKDLSFDAIFKTIKKIDSNLIQDCFVFDVFEDIKIGNTKKSIAVRLKIQAQDRTLTDKELLDLQNAVILNCEKIGAIIRDGQ